MMLARDGRQVTVLERDPSPVPEDPDAAWERWRRDGVVQFRQAHYLQPLGRAVLERELPDVLEAFKAAGAYRFDPIAQALRGASRTGARAGDERFVTWTGRRSTLEWVVARAAEREPGVEIRRGVGVTALETRRIDGRVHVMPCAPTPATGSPATSWSTRWAAARRCRSCSRRRAAIPSTRRPRTPASSTTRGTSAAQVPDVRGPVNTRVGTFSILTLPGDNGTW